MTLNEWEKCMSYADYQCAEFPNIEWTSYTMYDGKRGICLMLMDSNGSVYDELYTGTFESFKEMKAAFRKQMKRLAETM